MLWIYTYLYTIAPANILVSSHVLPLYILNGAVVLATIFAWSHPKPSKSK